MGYATSIGPCGCIMTKLMESGKIIQYERCAKHYVPEDDIIILEAMKNKREHDKEIWDEVNKVWDKR